MVKTYARGVKPVDMVNYRHAHKIDDFHYKVYGRDGNPYTLFVVVDKKRKVLITIACPCEIGLHNGLCFHKTVVVRRLLREKQIV